MIEGTAITVKVAALLVPALVVTVTLCGPGAAAGATLKLAVICVPLEMLTVPTDTPAPSTATVGFQYQTKLVPVRATDLAEPWGALDGVTEVSVGTDEVTVNVWALLVPADVVTVRFAGPSAAAGSIFSMMEIWVALVTVTRPFTVTPGLLTETVAPPMKLVPVRVTTIPLVPCAPLAGLIAVSVGAGGFTVNGAGLLVPPLVVTVTLATPVAAVAPMVNVAVIWVALTTVTPPAVTPGLSIETVAPATKLVPVRVTGTVAPWAPLAGLTEVSVGAAGFTVNATAPLVPPAVVTVMFAVPITAAAPMVNVAVIWAELTTVTLLAVTPGLLTATVAPATKLVPVRVTGTLVPCTPLAGLTDVSMGAGGFTVKPTALLVPPLVVTVTFAAPVAAAAPMVSVAVIWVELTTVTLLAVTPGLLTATVAPATKFVPARVTGTLVPWAPLAGFTDVNAGAGGFTVNTTGPLVPPLVVTVTFAAPVAAVAPMVNVAVI